MTNRNVRRRQLFFITVVLLLVVRLFWVVSGTESGWSQLWLQWRNATWGLVAGRYVPVSNRTAKEQGEFWLAETDRILKLHPDDAELLAGSALLLSDPCQGFEHNHLIQPGSLSVGILFTDWDAEREDLSAFDRATRSYKEELIRQATVADPNNSAWWQLRALLAVMEGTGFGFGASVSPDNFDAAIELLDRCAMSDPDQDNALYLLLKASVCMDQALELRPFAKFHTIANQQRFDQGMQALAEAQQKTRLTISFQAQSALERVLSYSSVPICRRGHILAGRNIDRYLSRLVQFHYELSKNLAEQAAAAGDLRGSLEHRLTFDQSLNQWNTSSSILVLLPWMSGPANFNAMQAKSTANSIASSLSRSERDAIDELYVRRSLTWKAYSHGASRYYADDYLGAREPFFTETMSATPSELLIETLPEVISMLAIAHMLVLWSASLGGRQDSSRAGKVLVTALAVFSFSATFLVLGLPLAPILMGLGHGVLLGLPTLTLVFLLLQSIRRRHFRFSMKSMFWVVLLIGLQLAIVLQFPLLRKLLGDAPYPVCVRLTGPPAMVWILSYSMELTTPSYLSAVALTQWTWHYGPLFAVSLWAASLGGVLARRMSKTERTDQPSLPSPLRLANETSRAIKPVLQLILGLTVLVYLAFVPWKISEAEGDFQGRMSCARDHELYVRTIYPMIELGESDHELMAATEAALRAGIEAEKQLELETEVDSQKSLDE